MPSSHPAPLRHGNHAAQQELAERLARLAPLDGAHATAIPSLHVMRSSHPKPCTPVLYEPRLCFVAQGSKLASLAGESWRYDPLNYLVVPITLPMIGEIVEATPEHPFLGMRLDLDLEQVSMLMLESRLPQSVPSLDRSLDRGLYAASASAPLLEAVLRLIRLLEQPQDLPVLAPLALREIHYRVLVDDLGQRLRDLASAGSRANRIAHAVNLLRRDYLKPLNIEALARSLHMSSSSLHHQFKAATSMSPLQFQKQLRLHEARRLMLTAGLDARSAAFQVGYESPSQFTREYKRAFGLPPRREVMQMKAVG